jgi:hypothetical protein
VSLVADRLPCKMSRMSMTTRITPESIRMYSNAPCPCLAKNNHR